jgi:hypothetical protein
MGKASGSNALLSVNGRASVKLTAVPPGKRAKHSRPGKGGPRSSRLVEMPMDLIFEVGMQYPIINASTQISLLLHPLDLLRLSRVSKIFRSLYLSQAARAIWCSTLQDVVPELPACPSDLNEAQYASLLFEPSCVVCSLCFPLYMMPEVRILDMWPHESYEKLQPEDNTMHLMLAQEVGRHSEATVAYIH